MRAMARRAWFVALALVVGPLSAVAESRYVTEQLTVGVYSEPEGGGERVALVKSGEQVELLEQQGAEARVRLESGMEGWMKATYLSPDPPPRVQLDERGHELERVRGQVRELEAQLVRLRTATAQRATRTAAPPVEPPAVTAGGASTTPTGAVDARTGTATAALAGDAALHITPWFGPRPAPRGAIPWGWMLVTALVALVAGFALGWRLLDRRIRKRYGGIKIY